MTRYLFNIKVNPTRRFFRSAGVLAGLLLAGCAVFTIEPSLMRPAEPATLALPNDVTLTHLGPMDIKVLGKETVLFSASFRVDAPGVVVYIDPAGVTDPVPADYILITHNHGDHFSPTDIERLCHDATVVVGPHKVVKALKDHQTMAVGPGERLELEGILVETVPMYNLEPAFLGITPHPEKAGYVGYVLTINGVRIYHAGDTSPVPGLAELEDITAALIPLGEDDGNLTMDTAEAAALVNAMGPEIAIPMHYELDEGYPERFRALVDDGIRVEI
ncbi:MAG: MBL fold metallo-hydrolase, partial [Fidelibacterota bacterium]